MVLRFNQFISETLVVYRGSFGVSNSPILWVSTSREHAGIYSFDRKTGAKGEVTEYRITKRIDDIDLGFRAAEISVPFEEVRGRLKTALMDRYEENRVTEKTAIDIAEKLDSLKYSGTKPVWFWMYKPAVIQSIRSMGFNCIKQREGIQSHTGNVITYGILDRSMISKIS